MPGSFARLAVPRAMTTLRKNSRIFQHISIPDIVTKVLGEWKITPELRILSVATHMHYVSGAPRY